MPFDPVISMPEISHISILIFVQKILLLFYLLRQITQVASSLTTKENKNVPNRYRLKMGND